MKNEFVDGILDLYDHFKDFFWGIGYFGWQLSVIYAVYVSFLNSWTDVLIFGSVFLFSGWLNHLVLKDYINDPRPKDSAAFLANEHIKIHQNGMPSGHAQLTAFSLAYSYLLSGQRLNESLALFGLTVFQRYCFKNHTLSQLFVGSLIGLAIAYLTVYCRNEFEKKN
jgi:membrane-associated phospholipid phosphatase